MTAANDDGPSDDQERAAELVAEEGGSEEEAELRYETEPESTPARAGQAPTDRGEPTRRPAAHQDVDRSDEPTLAEGPTGPLEAETSGTGVGSAGPE